MSNIFLCLIILLLIVRSQLRVKPLRRSLFTLPLLLLFYAIYLAAQAHVQPGEGISLALSALLGSGVGLFQGRLTRVYVDNSVWMMAGSWAGLAVWLLSIPLRFIVRYGFVELSGIDVVLTGAQAYVPFLFSIAGILLGKVLMLSLLYPEQMRAAAVGTFKHHRAR
ncbi:hypothetical protein [Paenibacillus aestuarii]|uniref:DUF1453 family protein n=1 Tax=Paenibacillus aestuarii TaxID=516965 RepID=A0ABW0KBN4_9BACL|nr:hypothetical protein [Paenibacillus aestuarii]